MARRSIDQQLADLAARQETEKKRVALRAAIGELKSAAGARDYGKAHTLAVTCAGLAQALEPATVLSSVVNGLVLDGIVPIDRKSAAAGDK